MEPLRGALDRPLANWSGFGGLCAGPDAANRTGDAGDFATS